MYRSIHAISVSLWFSAHDRRAFSLQGAYTRKIFQVAERLPSLRLRSKRTKPEPRDAHAD
jgi:hypothetical protein